MKWSVWLLEMTGGDWPPVMKGIISGLFSSQCSILGHIGFYSRKVYFSGSLAMLFLSRKFLSPVFLVLLVILM